MLLCCNAGNVKETNTEKILYGLDDIKGASDILIVEGEMDKLAMEEAGFKNCVSVPDGAPRKVSNKELPSAEKVHMYMGPSALRELIENAEHYPIKGLFNFKDYFTEIDQYYHQSLS
ncbi:Primaseprotein [Abeliophyllum distichum]|uniref:Primaseprotein n=1 Tax=Abeliophyllum distichum TaxID=126358 RepID=A0ABD1UHB8_9LAMI